MKIVGNEKEIEEMKDFIYQNELCPFCSHPFNECYKKIKYGCTEKEVYKSCVNEHIEFVVE